jgi:8-oxo-dGTP pyrophosphatase MutT (NUDIX family)
VLALVDPRSDSLPLLLLRRSAHLRDHPGQIGLPGGAHELADGPIWQTALREAEEELGVPPANVRLLGYTPAVGVRHTGFLIVPVVGALLSPFHVEIAEAEVDGCFWMPLRRSAQQVAIATRRVATHLGELSVPGYLYQGHFVWGATGIIVDDLRRRLGEEVAGQPPTT